MSDPFETKAREIYNGLDIDAMEQADHPGPQVAESNIAIIAAALREVVEAQRRRCVLAVDARDQQGLGPEHWRDDAWREAFSYAIEAVASAKTVSPPNS